MNVQTSMSFGSKPGISNYEANSSTSFANALISDDLVNASLKSLSFLPEVSWILTEILIS